MRIVLVNLPEEAFHRLPVDQYSPKFAATIGRINTIDRKKDLRTVLRLSKITEMEADYEFAQQTEKALREGKIHAEIQLLFYLEEHASKLTPRVISSSKDACFLCNAFILIHGKMHVPRSHGRLYPGWRFPLILKLGSMAE